MDSQHGEGRAVVVPAVGAPSSTTFLRSLGRREIPAIVVSEHPEAPAFSSRYAAETVEVPSPRENLLGYRDALLSLARREDVRTVVPMREEDAYVLAKYRDEFADHVEPLWPSLEALRTVHDRVRLVEAAAEAGVAVPETRPLDEVEDWDRERIVKSRYSILADEYDASLSSAEVREPTSTRYLEPGVEPDTGAIRAEMEHVPIVQEYVPGTEYAFWALYDRGEPVATCHKRQLRAWEYAGGTSIARETVRDPEIERVGRELLGALDWHGLAAVQFVRSDRTGEYHLLEVNPRTWISLSCAVQAGADFPYYFWRTAGGDPPDLPTDYEEGVATHLLRGEVSYLASVLRDDFPMVERPDFGTALWEVSSSLLDQPHLDYLSRDDPRPFARSLTNVAGRQFGGLPGDLGGVELPSLGRKTR